MPSCRAVVESEHELQNPTSPEKIRLLGDRMQLGSGSSVLDVASGRGGPAIILAEAFSCHITCLEKAEEFDGAARRRVGEAGLDSLIEFVLADARDIVAEREAYDAVLCLGASFIWDGLPGTLAALDPAVRDGGFIAVGEPYWREWPLPERAEPDEGEDYLGHRPSRNFQRRRPEGGPSPLTDRAPHGVTMVQLVFLGSYGIDESSRIRSSRRGASCCQG